jgi:hypothetical protein
VCGVRGAGTGVDACPYIIIIDLGAELPVSSKYRCESMKHRLTGRIDVSFQFIMIMKGRP